MENRAKKKVLKVMRRSYHQVAHDQEKEAYLGNSLGSSSLEPTKGGGFRKIFQG